MLLLFTEAERLKGKKEVTDNLTMQIKRIKLQSNKYFLDHLVVRNSVQFLRLILKRQVCEMFRLAESNRSYVWYFFLNLVLIIVFLNSFKKVVVEIMPRTIKKSYHVASYSSFSRSSQKWPWIHSTHVHWNVKPNDCLYFEFTSV